MKRIIVGTAIVLLAVAAATAYVLGRPTRGVAASPLALAPRDSGEVRLVKTHLPRGPVRLAVGTDGRLWLPFVAPNGDNRLISLDPTSGVEEAVRLPAAPGNPLQSAIVATGEDVWVAWERTLVRVDGSSHDIRQYRIPQAVHVLDPAKIISTEGFVRGEAADPINALALGGDGCLWIGRQYSTALMRFDPVTCEFEEVALPEGFGSIQAIEPDESGNLWLTVAISGSAPSTPERPRVLQDKYGVFSPSSRELIQIDEPTGPLATVGNAVYRVRGELLSETSKALRGTALRSFLLPSRLDSRTAIKGTRNGRVVVAGRNGLLVFSPGNGGASVYHVPAESTRMRIPAGAAVSPTASVLVEAATRVTDIEEDAGGRVWLAMPELGLGYVVP